MNWLLLNSGKCDAALNMALDEALLDSVARLARPILRLYGWMEPAATFGYFQKYADVERATKLRPLVRRPTGGGIVPHDADWTYSAVFPPGHEWHLLKAEESYRRIHEWIRSAFARLKIETELAPDAKKSAPGQCFAGHEKFDLLWRGKKIAGAAQRRNKLGLLIQGSVQPPAFRTPNPQLPTPNSELRTPSRTDWEKSMCAVAENQFGVHWQAFSPDAELLASAERLAREKFSGVGR